MDAPPPRGFCPGSCKTSASRGARKGGAPRGRSQDGGSLQRPRGPAGAALSQAHRGPCRKRKPGRGWGRGEAQSRRSRRVRPRAPRGGVCAARVRGRLAAGRYLPGPGVCLPTNCRGSAATHSDVLNKRPARAVWSRFPRGLVAAASEPRCRSPGAGERDGGSPEPPQPKRLGYCAAPFALGHPGPASSLAFLPLRPRFPDCPSRPATPVSLLEKTPRQLGLERVHRPSDLSVLNFPTAGCPGGRAPAPASVRSLRAVANPRRLSGRCHRRVPGTEPKSETRGAPMDLGGRGKAMGGTPSEPLSQARALRWKRHRETLFPGS